MRTPFAALHSRQAGLRIGALVLGLALCAALFLGTMGLPQVLARLYTNPDGRSARKAMLTALVLLGIFFLFPTVFGVLSRLFITCRAGRGPMPPFARSAAV